MPQLPDELSAHSPDSDSQAGCHDGDKLAVLVCPGFHRKALTQGFVRSLPAFVAPHIVPTFPADPVATFQSIKFVFRRQPIVAIGFSAGVVGLVGALKLWQHQGGQIHQIFVIDGWGVPSLGLPISRISHDAFTHWSSLPLGLGNVNFYADPGVPHLQMWGIPEHVAGWQTGRPTDLSVTVTAPFNSRCQAMTAQDFLHSQLHTCFGRLVR
ncbi:MAG: hypothetical protein AAF703_19760 [Cyanobacteria bacterium P01_D01_bin.105]